MARPNWRKTIMLNRMWAILPWTKKVVRSPQYAPSQICSALGARIGPQRAKAGASVGLWYTRVAMTQRAQIPYVIIGCGCSVRRLVEKSHSSGIIIVLYCGIGVSFILAHVPIRAGA